ncbi:unnamed protein product [Symbiodinium natans]|uniref:Uncharacterized protein n=1 Tax=Symbiodinium natans TaxID=878477 RepID=A0A812RSI6_9DINO|nr:unnamed protein product [Symbiodinium natans]
MALTSTSHKQLMLSCPCMSVSSFVSRSEGLDNSIKTASRVMGVYVEQADAAAKRCEQPVFKKTDEAKPSFLYFDAQKERWRIAKSMEEKGDYAHIKDKGQLPWQLKKPWKVYNGDKYEEVSALQVQEADPSVQEEAKANKGRAKTTEKRGKVKESSTATGNGSKRTRDRKWLGQQMSADELPLEALKELPKDAPNGHDAWKVVKWEPSNNRALFQFKGVRIQTTQFGCGSKHAAEVVARACYVMLADGKGKDEVMNFRDGWYRRIRSFKAGEAATANGQGSSSDISPNERKNHTAPDEGKEQASSPSPDEIRESSSSSGSEDSDSAGKGSDTESQEDAVDAGGQKGFGFLDPRNPPGALGRVCAKMAVRTGIRCFKCYFERHKCQCKST